MALSFMSYAQAESVECDNIRIKCGNGNETILKSCGTTKQVAEDVVAVAEALCGVNL